MHTGSLACKNSNSNKNQGKSNCRVPQRARTKASSSGMSQKIIDLSNSRGHNATGAPEGNTLDQDDDDVNMASSRVDRTGGELSAANISDSLCTKDRNIRDALEYMKMLQDLTISTSMNDNTMQNFGKDKVPELDEALLKKLQDFEVVEVLDKRQTDLTAAEKVVLSVHLINQQIGVIDQFVQKISAHQEQNFLNAYSGHMGMVMRELRNFKNKINSERFEMKKNTQIKNLQAEVDYFQEEALRLRELDKEQEHHIKQVHHENEGLRDDAYVLRQALLNTKIRQRDVQRQLEETKNDNIELMVQVQSLQTQLREQLINFQKQQLIQTALTDEYVVSPRNATQDFNQHMGSQSDKSTTRITNIQVSEQVSTAQTGGQLVSFGPHTGATGTSEQDSVVNGSGVVSVAGDEQGIRAFLLKIIQARHLFAPSDIVDQIEAFIQIKIDRCNQMVRNFRDRLARAEKETKHALLENKRLSTDQFVVQKAFKQCIEQIAKDKKRDTQRKLYQNASLMDPTRNNSEMLSQISFTSGGPAGQHTQQRKVKRLQSAQLRRGSGVTTASQTTRGATGKLTSRHSQPSKGIYVLKSKIGQNSQKDALAQPPNQSNDDLDGMDVTDVSYQTAMTRQGRNIQRTTHSQAFTTMQDKAAVPLVGPSPEQFFQNQQMQTLASPQTFGDDNALGSERGPSLNSQRLKEHEKRQIVENFLKDEQVFRVLYDTVFRSPAEGRDHRPEELLKTNSMGQIDVLGQELEPDYVNKVSFYNEQLLDALVVNSSTAGSPRGQYQQRRNQSEFVDYKKGTGAFFMSDADEQQPVLAIEDRKRVAGASSNDQNRQQNNNSSTFFVTLQEAAQKKPVDQMQITEVRDSGPQTLRASMDETQNNTFNIQQQETEDDQQQSHEVQDEVNQLDFDEPHAFALGQAASKGNLNVQTLIEQSKQRTVRPQSSRPMLRPKFMTLDPSANRLGAAAAGFGQLTSIENLREEESKLQPISPEIATLAAQACGSQPNFVQHNRLPSAATRKPLPGPSFMIRDRSEFINHMLELETMGRLSQKAINKKHLSPRSSRLLASRHFMNRNSTAGSSGLAGQGKLSSQRDSQILAQVYLRDPKIAGATIGRSRPMSSKVATAPVNKAFVQKRQRLGSAKIRSNLQGRGGMIHQTTAQSNLRAGAYHQQPAAQLRTGILSSNSSNTFFNQTQK